MELLLGKPVVDSLKETLVNEIANCKRKPKLVILLNAEDPSSKGYANALFKFGESVNVDVEIIDMVQDEITYLTTIDRLNNDKSVDAVLISRPLNKSLDENKIIASLSYTKDVDGINHISLGKLFVGDESLVPNTANAICKMLEFYNVPLKGKKVLVVGRSLSVGKPVSMLLMNRHATVTIAHSRTENLNEELGKYDIVIAALGRPHLLKGEYMKEGAIVIDAGIHYLENGIIGDVEPHEKLSLISKVPGGVGPITNACLMMNVLSCYRMNN